MRGISIFLYEWKHFSRSSFKIVALFLFCVASIYGLHNGADLYLKQHKEIEKLNEKVKADIDETIGYFDSGAKGPEARPRVDVTTPYWAIRNATTYHYKTPSPSIVYNIGQTEHYGFYKAITISSSPYDTDMAKEIANPERIQSGTLDFAFVLLFLLPLLLLVLLYNIKGAEAEQGFLALVYVQTGSKKWWIISRTLFYVFLLIAILLGLMLYGAALTNPFEDIARFWSIFALVVSYVLFWTLIYFFIISYGRSTVSNTLQMIGVWLLFAFIIPATIQQWVSIEKPTNLMIDVIDARRDKTEDIYAQTDANTDTQIFNLYPNFKTTKAAKDTLLINKVRRNSKRALVNNALKNATKSIDEDNAVKNQLISKTYWFNPLTYFQNSLNLLTETHYNDYQRYRNEIQQLVDKRLEVMLMDMWNDVTVDKKRYLEYITNFSSNE
jgi:ABC-2 type transport system permease protein